MFSQNYVKNTFSFWKIPQKYPSAGDRRKGKFLVGNTDRLPGIRHMQYVLIKIICSWSKPTYNEQYRERNWGYTFGSCKGSFPLFRDIMKCFCSRFPPPALFSGRLAAWIAALLAFWYQGQIWPLFFMLWFRVIIQRFKVRGTENSLASFLVDDNRICNEYSRLHLSRGRVI